MTPDVLSAEDEALYNMSDEELEAAFREAKSAPDVEDEVQADLDVEVEVADEIAEDVAEDDVEIDAEQPDEDSDQEEVEIDDEESQVEDEAADEIAEVDTNEDVVEDVKPSKLKYKANGHEYEFTPEEVQEQFGKVFGQSMNYTQKMQEVAPWRKTISALKDNGYSHDDVNLMIDVLKGDKDALAEVVKKSGLDVMDLGTEEENVYTPKEYGKSEMELDIDDVVSSISKDPEYQITQHVVDKQWDDGSREFLAKNPSMISALHVDVKSGMFDTLSPMMMKAKILDGGSKTDIEYYGEAFAEYTATQEAEANAQVELDRVNEQKAVEQAALTKAKNEQVARENAKKVANKRKAAAPTGKLSGKKDVVDYLDSSDEDFEEWYTKLQAQM